MTNPDVVSFGVSFCAPARDTRATCRRASRTSVELTVLACRSGDAEANFSDALVSGINVRLLDARERDDASLVRSVTVEG